MGSCQSCPCLRTEAGNAGREDPPCRLESGKWNRGALETVPITARPDSQTWSDKCECACEDDGRGGLNAGLPRSSRMVMAKAADKSLSQNRYLWTPKTEPELSTRLPKLHNIHSWASKSSPLVCLHPRTCSLFPPPNVFGCGKPHKEALHSDIHSETRLKARTLSVSLFPSHSSILPFPHTGKDTGAMQG